MSFEAKFPGRCIMCEERIIPGEHVQYSLDDVLIHDICTEPAPARPVEVCGKCWLTKPCDCEDECLTAAKSYHGTPGVMVTISQEEA